MEEASSVECRVLVHALAFHEGGHDPYLADRARATVEQVAVQDRKIRVLSGLDRAGDIIEMVDPGGPGRERRQDVDQVDPFIGQERRLLAAAPVGDPLVTRVDGPRCGVTARSGPTATIRPSRTASALAKDRAASIVAMRPPVRTRSAGRSRVIGGASGRACA